jgi:hypothetical protein
MKGVLTETVRYPYVDEPGWRHIEEKRGDLGELLRRSGAAVQIDDGVARWWTFAGGRVNHTLKYGLEVAEGWKVVADNFQLRIEGNWIGHESVRVAIEKMARAEFWDAPEMRRAVLGRLPGYRLSKFQDCLPEGFALEVIESYLLDVAGTVRWLHGGVTSRARTVQVQLRSLGAALLPHLAPALEGRWADLPDRLSVDDLNAVAHMVDGYAVATEHLGREAFAVAEDLRRTFRETGEWRGTAVELLAGFFAVVRGWRGDYSGPADGDKFHQEALTLYQVVRRRLHEHPDEVQLLAASSAPRPRNE